MKFLALLFLVSCGGNDITRVVGSKFKVGDCIDSEDAEFIMDHPRKILQVGKRNYLYKYRNIVAESSIHFIDTFSVKVDCKSVGY